MSSTAMPSDNDWLVLRILINRLLTSNPPKQGSPRKDDEVLSCQLRLIDIAASADMGTPAVRKYLQRLEERGIIERHTRPGPHPTVFSMEMGKIRLFYRVIDAVVGFGAPWPGRSTPCL